MGSGTSSEGSIFMALTILSPSRVDAQRLRDMSEESNNPTESRDVVGGDSNDGRPFKCLTWE